MFHKPIEVFPDRGHCRAFGWSRTHAGDDDKANLGDCVCAMPDGAVVRSEDVNGFGSLNPSSLGGCIIQHTQVSIASSLKNFYAIYGQL